MDNNILVNNPLQQYLTPQPAEEGLVCIVADFDEAKKKFATPEKPHVYFTKDMKTMFAKLVDKDGTVNMATFRNEQIPNPVPITGDEFSGTINEIRKDFNDKFALLQSQIEFIASKLTEGKTDGSSGVLQQKSDIAGSLTSKEPVFRQ